MRLQAFFAGLLDLEVCRAGDDNGREVLNHRVPVRILPEPLIAGPPYVSDQLQAASRSKDERTAAIATWHEPPEMIAPLDHNRGYMPTGRYPQGFQAPAQVWRP